MVWTNREAMMKAEQNATDDVAVSSVCATQLTTAMSRRSIGISRESLFEREVAPTLLREPLRVSRRAGSQR
jgi:hypothetical protein